MSNVNCGVSGALAASGVIQNGLVSAPEALAAGAGNETGEQAEAGEIVGGVGAGRLPAVGAPGGRVVLADVGHVGGPLRAVLATAGSSANAPANQ